MFVLVSILFGQTRKLCGFTGSDLSLLRQNYNARQFADYYSWLLLANVCTSAKDVGKDSGRYTFSLEIPGL